MNQRLIFIHLQRFLWMTIVMVVLGPMFAWGYVDKYNDGQKRVLMLGDSITIMSTGVGPQIREAFAGLANVHIISGLEAGDYSFTGYFHDSDASHGTADVNVSVDGGQNFTDAMDVTYTTGMSPASIGTGSFTFTSDGMNDVVFHISVTGGDGTSVLNGFEIVTADVPEPSTIVLLCLGSLSLAIYRFRRSLLSNY